MRLAGQVGVAGDVIAIDVAVLLEGEAAARARAVNAVLAAGHADALRLDGTHLPHVTLAQQFVERARLDDLFAELDRILRHEPEVQLAVSGASLEARSVHLVVDPAPDLQRLHELIMDAIEPFESPEGGADAFEADDETIRRRDVEWVRSYREHAAYAHYRPHVTVGHGETVSPFAAAEWPARRVAVCRLGRFCTCRSVLRDWVLA